MLYLHKKNDELGQTIKDYLSEISADHKQVDIDDAEESFIRENDRVVKGEINIYKYLDALKRKLEDERLLSADACIMNPRDGKMC
ncbi:MAG: hypothetical protein AAF731_21685 [Bacteroidota bacterium]